MSSPVHSPKRQFIFSIGSLTILLIALLVGTKLVQQNQDTRSKAQTTNMFTDLSYTIDHVLGQPNTKETQLNQIVGNRGFHLGGVHFDSLDRVYVLDSGNNRILGFQSFTGANQDADIVIGQPSVTESGTTNGDNTTFQPPTANTLAIQPYPDTISTLESPRSMEMATDAQNNLYVVDLNNNRVLKYNDPFTTDQAADDVWGQPDFTSRQGCTTPTASNLCLQWSGAAVYSASVDIDATGNVWVTDTGNHRVLRYPPGSKTADLVLGQSSFTTNTPRFGFENTLQKMQKPLSVRVKPTTGEIYVLEGQETGQNRVLVFSPPFTNGMTATRTFGAAFTQLETPVNQTNWQFLGDRWVYKPSGLYFARGLAFNKADPTSAWVDEDVWINDGANARMVLYNTQGQMIDVLGQPNFDAIGCYGGIQGYIGRDGSSESLCNNDGEIGIDSQGRLHTGKMYFPRDISRFALPIQRNTDGKAISDGWLLHGESGAGWNQFSGKTFQNSYGMSLSPTTNPPQLFVSDGQRILVFNNYTSVTTYQHADYVIGQDIFTTNTNNNGGTFSAVYLNSQTVGNGHLWVSAGDRIFAFALPITTSGKNYPPAKVLFTGAYESGNVFWADDGTKVPFGINGIKYDPTQDALWVSDANHNRVLRIGNPLGAAQVDLVIGQPSKSSSGENASQGTPSARGFGKPWSLNFDRFGNLYVVDGGYEGRYNNRVLRFSAADTNPATHNGNLFPFPEATGVYAKQNFTSPTSSWGPGTPQHPTYVEFDSFNRMYLLVDSYGNSQNERIFVYPSSHTVEVAPQPTHKLPLPFGQTAFAYFNGDDNHLILQDHTWNRILFTTLSGMPEPFTNLQAFLGSNSAQFSFTTPIPGIFHVDLATSPDMLSDVYLSFGSGQSPVFVADPQIKWDKYQCGATLYWRVLSQDRTQMSPIQTAVVCDPNASPLSTPLPTLVPTPTPSPTPLPTPSPLSTLQFHAQTSNGIEGSQQTNIVVELSPQSNQQVTVNYRRSSGSAIQDADYTMVGNTLVFPPGIRSQVIPLTIIDDSQTETKETIVLQLSNPTNAVLGNTTKHALGILDND